MMEPHSAHNGASATMGENGSSCCGSASVGRNVGVSPALLLQPQSGRSPRRLAAADPIEAAKYFSDRFAGVRDVDHNVGLWSWLALFYFDELCPPDASGQRQVREDARYIPGTGWRRYYRHLLAAPLRVYRSHGDNAGLLLLDPVDKLGDIWEQLASRQEIITNLGILGTATLLYLDTKKDRPKRGAASTKRKPGTLRRFVDLIQQLDLTYDLYSMQPTEILVADGIRWLAPAGRNLSSCVTPPVSRRPLRSFAHRKDFRPHRRSRHAWLDRNNTGGQE